MSTPARLALPPHVAQRLFGDGAALAATLADEVARWLHAALAARGRATLVVSGGRTPVAFFHALAVRELDWTGVTVTLADERWVPLEHPASNAGLVHAALLGGAPARATFVSLYGGERTAEEGVAAATTRLAALARPFDVVVLGMGADGHTASLFPGDPALAGLLAEGAPALGATRAPTAPHSRITLSLPTLLDARHLVVHVEGADKAAVIEAAAREADALARPIAAVLHQARTPVTVFFAPSD